MCAEWDGQRSSPAERSTMRMKVEDAVIGYAKMKEQQKSLRTQLDRVERLLAEASVALQKLIVSSGVKQVIYD